MSLDTCPTDSSSDSANEFALLSNNETVPAVPGSALVSLQLLNRVSPLSSALPNSVMSPISIVMALVMAWVGSKGTSAAEMESVLQFSSQTPAVLHELLTKFDSLTTHDGPVTFANRACLDSSLSLQPSFIVSLNSLVDSSFEQLNFSSAPEASRLLINEWVAQKTNQTIVNLLNPGTITYSTVFVLVNAVYFNASWKYPFDQSFTYAESFTLSDGTTVSVPFMHYPCPDAANCPRFGFTVTRTFTALNLRYSGSPSMYMLILFQKDHPLPHCSKCARR